MLGKTLWMAALVIGMSSAQAHAESIQGLPLHVQKLGDRAIRVWLGDYISSTSVVAVSTSKGIAVIDTFGDPAVDVELRKVIARELGRNDFTYLINTHDHRDHTGGNLAYADCTIIAHSSCAVAMKASESHREEAVSRYGERIGQVANEMSAQAAGSDALKKLQEEFTLNRLLLSTLQKGGAPTLPTRTFDERMKINMGNTTLELFYTGGMHSSSDISVLVPELGLLMTGDTMADKWLTDTPGCLAAFRVRPDVDHDFKLLLRNWGLILQRKDQITDLIPGHWNGDLSIEGFEARVNYVRTVWTEVNQWVSEGKSLDLLLTAHPLKEEFPNLVGSPGFAEFNHQGTLVAIWTDVTDMRSAASALYEALGTPGGEAAMAEIVDSHQKGRGEYYFLEREINMYGYRLLQETRVNDAIAMFKMNVHIFPNSWNVYDSLGEATAIAGDIPQAISYYRKSIELNPDNKSGKEALDRLEQRQK